MKAKKYKIVLTIAGSDCSGGAGIQADLKTFFSLGCYGLSVITALTAQNTRGVKSIFPISVDFVQQQLESIFSDIEVNVIKTGMLFSSDIIKVVARYVEQYESLLVVDPVMVSKSGNLLLKRGSINILKKKLFPLTTLLTPNIYELESLLNRSIKNKYMVEQAAKELCYEQSSIHTRNCGILVKGGHLHLYKKTSDDCLYVRKEDKIYWFKSKRIDTNNTHGTGCTLSAAIGAFLALGNDLVDSVYYAKKYITKSLLYGKNYCLGSSDGNGPVFHFA